MKRQKVKYIVYGILWTVLWLFSMAWIDEIFYSLLTEPHVLTFILLAMVLFCMWEGISGLTQNILRIRVDKVLKELEGAMDVGKRED